MLIRQVKQGRWGWVCDQVTTYGRGAPLCLQFDLDINCNGVEYILKVQPMGKRKLAVLQALCVSQGGQGRADYSLIEDNGVLSALIELMIYQGAAKQD